MIKLSGSFKTLTAKDDRYEMGSSIAVVGGGVGRGVPPTSEIPVLQLHRCLTALPLSPLMMVCLTLNILKVLNTRQPVPPQVPWPSRPVPAEPPDRRQDAHASAEEAGPGRSSQRAEPAAAAAVAREGSGGEGGEDDDEEGFIPDVETIR